MLTRSQINRLVTELGILVLDGGLATELERQGYDLHHDLWSAQLLMTNPDAIGAVHRSYLEAGSMCITTASYQASIAGLVAAGIAATDARQILIDSVIIAKQAVAEFTGRPWEANDTDRPLVAASIGPYGACLADGSEYRGNYGVSRQQLTDFHAQRFELICEGGPDLLACETIPSFLEAQVLHELLKASPEAMAWVSFSCTDGEHISDGTPLQECAALLETCPQVFAVGVNCTAPQYVGSLIANVRAAAPDKQVVVYPNSGQQYDALRRVWTGSSDAFEFGKLAVEWQAAGATLIGGCCQTGPEHIRAICHAVSR